LRLMIGSIRPMRFVVVVGRAVLEPVAGGAERRTGVLGPACGTPREVALRLGPPG
jgi:hypothetical protein